MDLPALAQALREPIELPPNPLNRFYRAGGRLAAFRGDAMEAHDERPEDWVGSATRAWLPAGAPSSRPGLSEVVLNGLRTTLEDVLRLAPNELAGDALVRAHGPTLGVLVKLLDAGQRLPVHCHPSRRHAQELIGSRFGKTEAWLILATDDAAQPRVWAGVREPVAREQFRSWIEAQDSEALLGSLVEYAARPGDVYLIPGGTPHAIGEGVFLLELQEPTDYSIVAETRGFPVESADASLGLGWDQAIDFFDLQPVADLRQPADQSAGVSRLLGREADAYFRALRMRVDGEAQPPFAPGYAVGVVLGGGGAVHGATSELQVARGSTFALPAAAVEVAQIDGDGLDLVWCLGPNPAALG